MTAKKVERISELKNVYLLYGDEEMLMESALAKLKERMAAEVDLDFNMEVLDAAEAGLERVVDSAETVPLLSERRLVIVTDA